MMKKQRKSSSSKWSESEMEVAEIIRDLYCISLLSSIPFSWGCKRKRSAIQNTPSLIIHNRAVNPSAVALPHPSTTVAIKTDAPSPETPLSFPATESDDKPKHSSKKKTSLKREKESSLQIIQDLTKTKSSLNQEIEKVQQHYDRLKSINSKLKIRKQELLCNSNERKSELKSPNLEINQKQLEDQSNGSVNPSKSTAENEEHSKNQQQIQMFPSDETVSLAVASSSSVGLGRTMNNGPIALPNGPIVLPDLNLPTEELMNVACFQPLDEAETTTNRANVAAQARHRRLEIFRLKKPFGNNSKQHQC